MQSNRILSTIHRIASLLEAESAAKEGVSIWMERRAAEVRKFIRDGIIAAGYVNARYSRYGYIVYPYTESSLIQTVGTEYSDLRNAFVYLNRPKQYSEADKELLKQLAVEAQGALQATKQTEDPDFKFFENLESLIATLQRNAG